MKKITYIFILIFSYNLLLTGCEKDFLDTYPTEQVSSATIITTTGNAMSALNGIHRALYIRYDSQGRGGAGSFNMNMDELGEDHVFNSATWTTSYRWILNSNPTNSYNTSHWAMFYKWIANANILINGVDQAEGEQEERDIIKGQALLYRAYAHYQLVQVWAGAYKRGVENQQAGVPIRLDNSTEPLARATVEEVYTQINEDIDAAIVLLQGYVRENKSHLNANVGKGLKARVALTQGSWSIAAQYAREARDGYLLMDQETYALGFRDDAESNDEFMWASHIVEDQTNYYGNLGAYISRNYSSSSIRANPRSINNLLYDMISPTDVRATLWDPTGEHLNLPPGIEIVENASRHPYTNQKFLTVSTSDSRMDVPMMRAAEMYLIEAEALARNGQGGPAAQVLFEMVSTRDDNYTLSTNTGQDLIDEIMIQRRVELWGEGFRWLDLKRLNLPLDRTGSNHTESITNEVLEVPAGDNRWIWAIPQDEIDANPLIEQNPI
ncbi:RagB/SusD family nutrient uptake outer membrane protein [Abyssalbus ytuae]|uniref:RagB/SusD family nutrient uptake outer membrane protein n=1 Tax=Abyssalbus ytuae TaxID=2926907 RepID=A0A9E6ZM13_9FLAO|nr:RagB/SusD family nutrient uptake outer membrane protein [Abyssalbus ytuae]UOB17134.1 RagB/SusD family nutrient uptake outer membrane protein [Abyssalbus ytuae]